MSKGNVIDSLAIVIPVYNEDAVIEVLFDELRSFKKSVAYDVRVIFVDDNSSDESSRILRETAEAEPWFSYLRLSRRSGSHLAIIAGLSYCNSDCAVFLAADLQDPISLVPEMIDLCSQGNDIVWGNRDGRDGQSWFEHYSSFLFYKMMQRLTYLENIPFQASFALLSRRAYSSLVANVGKRVSLIVEIPSLGFKTANVLFRKPTRKGGVSKWSTGRKILALADAVVASSYMPLRLMTYIGFVVSFLGLLYAAMLIALFFSGYIQVQGWASLIIVILILGGLQISMMGVIGEYLWRVSENTHNRALFLVEESVNIEDKPSRKGPNGKI